MDVWMINSLNSKKEVRNRYFVICVTLIWQLIWIDHIYIFLGITCVQQFYKECRNYYSNFITNVEKIGAKVDQNTNLNPAQTYNAKPPLNLPSDAFDLAGITTFQITILSTIVWCQNFCISSAFDTPHNNVNAIVQIIIGFFLTWVHQALHARPQRST